LRVPMPSQHPTPPAAIRAAGGLRRIRMLNKGHAQQGG
jgi:hypothetical protein